MKISQAERKEAKAERREAKAESDSAFERLRADNQTALERLRVSMAEHNAKVAEQSKDIIKFIATMSVGIVAVLGAFIAFLQFYK